MPKDQLCLSKPSLSSSSSKNAKDKSNSMTLLATRNTEDVVHSSGRDSCHGSEKDSGFSDWSDWQQTDAEDGHGNRSQSRGDQHAEPSRPGQTKECGQENPGNPALIPAGGQPLPIYIISNTPLKQPDLIQKRRQLPRRSISRVTGSSGAAHMVFLQQPSLFPTNLHLHKPPSRKCSATGRTTKGAYLPILNSYPRIAPHPSKKPPDKSTPCDKSQSLSRSVCAELDSDGTTVTSSLPEQQLLKHLSGLPRSPLSSSVLTTASSTRGSSSGSSLFAASSFLSTRGIHRNGVASARHRRFLNTIEILQESGLLGITLRTKELLRQSHATERDIAQLRQHTELLCQAVSNPGRNLHDAKAWEQLYRSMAESGSYPDLQNLQIQCRVESAGQTKGISIGGASGPRAADKSEALQTRSGQGREPGCKCSGKVAFMPPDSSTG